MIEQTRFLSTVFLCSEFKLENIYSGVNFCGKNVCGNFYLRELNYFHGSHETPQKWQKLEPAKISYHTVVLQRCDDHKQTTFQVVVVYRLHLPSKYVIKHQKKGGGGGGYRN